MAIRKLVSGYPPQSLRPVGYTYSNNNKKKNRESLRKLRRTSATKKFNVLQHSIIAFACYLTMNNHFILGPIAVVLNLFTAAPL